MKSILVTGSNGLLGQKLTARLLDDPQFSLIATSKGANRYPIKEGYLYVEMDILDHQQVKAIIEEYQPDAIIHTAAMTNVDTCHVSREMAYELNVDAVQNLVSLCESFKIQLIHLSTDFVFDGVNGPYSESAPPNPVSYYGQTKLWAEEAIQLSKADWAIIRTILVYGIVTDLSRSNIVLWAKDALEKGSPINVVNDQWRMPTLAEDLADACVLAVKNKAKGIFHVSGKDQMSIAELVGRVADFWKLDRSVIYEVSSETLNQDAKRPLRTGFVLDKAITQLGYQPHSFEEGLTIVRQQLEIIG